MIRHNEHRTETIRFPDWVTKPSTCRTATTQWRTTDRHGVTTVNVPVIAKMVGYSNPADMIKHWKKVRKHS